MQYTRPPPSPKSSSSVLVYKDTIPGRLKAKRSQHIHQRIKIFRIYLAICKAGIRPLRTKIQRSSPTYTDHSKRLAKRSKFTMNNSTNTLVTLIHICTANSLHPAETQQVSNQRKLQTKNSRKLPKSFFKNRRKTTNKTNSSHIVKNCKKAEGPESIVMNPIHLPSQGQRVRSRAEHCESLPKYRSSASSNLQHH